MIKSKRLLSLLSTLATLPAAAAIRTWDGGGAHLHFGGASQIYQGENPITLRAVAASALTVDGVLSAPDNLFLDGGGLITLNGAKSLNSYALIWNGTSVVLHHGHGPGAGGTGRIEVVNSTLQINSASNQTMPRKMLLAGASPYFYSSGGNHTYSGNWRLYGTGHRYVVVTSGSLTLTGTVATEGVDHGVLVKQGPGTMRLTGTEGNAFTDTLRVDEGILELDKPGFAKKAVSCADLQWTVADFGQETELICNAPLLKNAALPDDPASVIITGAGNLTLGGDHTIDHLTYSGTGRLTGTTGFSENMDLTLNSGTLSGAWNEGGVSPDGGVGDFVAAGGVVDLRNAAKTQAGKNHA